MVNEIEITASPGFMTRTNDAYLTSKVKTLLVTADGVPANSIKVTTDKSVVYLMGVVTSVEGDKATDVARNASGVQKVVKVFDYVSEAERARLDQAGLQERVYAHVHQRLVDFDGRRLRAPAEDCRRRP